MRVEQNCPRMDESSMNGIVNKKVQHYCEFKAKFDYFVCVGVMYSVSGEYDVCDVTQSNITNIKANRAVDRGGQQGQLPPQGKLNLQFSNNYK